MSHEAELPCELFTQLSEIDEAVAAEVRVRGCGHCGGVLDRGHYPRKVRGLPEAQEAAWSRRISWCCRRCRQRTTPPSVRFLGRRVYAAPWVVVAAPARTVRRWTAWWRTAFVATGLWRDVRGRLAAPVDETALPESLLARWSGARADRVVALLRLVAPLSSRTARAPM